MRNKQDINRSIILYIYIYIQGEYLNNKKKTRNN